MRRTRIIALVAVPVLLLGAGCRGGAGARGGDPDPAEATVTGPAAGGATEEPTGSSDGGGAADGGAPDAGVEGQFDDVESTLNSIESEMADDGR
jgi:hypothetical protein